jgi:hypothetical protein
MATHSEFILALLRLPDRVLIQIFSYVSDDSNSVEYLRCEHAALSLRPRKRQVYPDTNWISHNDDENCWTQINMESKLGFPMGVSTVLYYHLHRGLRPDGLVYPSMCDCSECESDVWVRSLRNLPPFEYWRNEIKLTILNRCNDGNAPICCPLLSEIQWVRALNNKHALCPQIGVKELDEKEHTFSDEEVGMYRVPWPRRLASYAQQPWAPVQSHRFTDEVSRVRYGRWWKPFVPEDDDDGDLSE